MDSGTSPRLILASRSPRRKEMLSTVGVMFEVIPALVDEVVRLDEEPENAAIRIAEEKAEVVAQQYPDRFVLAADTLVVVSDSASNESDSGGEREGFTILGKPADKNEALEMLRKLQGREHSVVTGIALRCVEQEYSLSRFTETKVRLRELTDGEIQRYLSVGESLDKAGAYAIQGIGGTLVDQISGSYSNVVGLPLPQILQELKSCNLWDPNKEFSGNR